MHVPKVDPEAFYNFHLEVLGIVKSTRDWCFVLEVAERVNRLDYDVDLVKAQVQNYCNAAVRVNQIRSDYQAFENILNRACRTVLDDEFRESLFNLENDLNAHHMALRICCLAAMTTQITIFPVKSMGWGDPDEWERRIVACCKEDVQLFVRSQGEPSEFKRYYREFYTMLKRETDYILDWSGFNPFRSEGNGIPSNITTAKKLMFYLVQNRGFDGTPEEFDSECRKYFIDTVSKESCYRYKTEAKNQKSQSEQN